MAAGHARLYALWVLVTYQLSHVASLVTLPDVAKNDGTGDNMWFLDQPGKSRVLEDR